MTGLSAEQIRALHEQLLVAERELQDSIDQRKSAATVVELDQAAVGRLSRMDALQQQAMAKAAEQRAISRLSRVRGALQRLENDTYGRCEDCDEMLDIRRLQTDPCAAVCLECQHDRDADAAADERRRQMQGPRS